MKPLLSLLKSIPDRVGWAVAVVLLVADIALWWFILATR